MAIIRKLNWHRFSDRHENCQTSLELDSLKVKSNKEQVFQWNDSSLMWFGMGPCPVHSPKG